MTRKLMLVLAIWPVLIIAAEESSTTYQVVSVTDIGKQTSFKVVSQSEYVTLQGEVQNKNRLLPKAIALAKKEWESDGTNKGKTFLQNAVSEGKIKPLGTFKKKEDAEAKSSALEKGLNEKTGKADFLEKKLEGLQNSLKAQDAKSKPASWINNVKLEIKMTEDSIARRKAKQGEREELEDSARNLIISKVEELSVKSGPGEKKKE